MSSRASASAFSSFLSSSAILALAAITTACGGSSASSIDSTGDGGGGGTPGSSAGAVTPSCLDGTGKPTSACAVTPKANVCSLGDANACLTTTALEVYADDGKNGVCMHLVYRNDCSAEVYADTCIGTKDFSGWECWTSSVLPGFTIDVSQCKATGEYFQVATKSSGQLDLDEKKCPAPM